MERKDELSPGEVEHVRSLVIRSRILKDANKPWTDESAHQFFEKVRGIMAHLTPHERRVFEAEELSMGSLRKAIRSAKSKPRRSQGRTIRGRKKSRRAK